RGDDRPRRPRRDGGRPPRRPVHRQEGRGDRPEGRVLSADTIGEAVAVRDLMTDLREVGAGTGPMTSADRFRFRGAPDVAVIVLACIVVGYRIYKRKNEGNSAPPPRKAWGRAGSISKW